jgi:alpha-D-ribose 1-methylphosphonate 5-triphosphate synthase subunit PhnH
MRPGFADPVLDAQAAFRAVMDAMARPGRLGAAAAPEPPVGLGPAMAAVALTLCDADTPVWTNAGAEARAWLTFHTGAPLVEDPAAAAFLLATRAMPPLAALAAGSDEAPQEGATLVVEVTALTPGAGWRLTGPGIADAHRLAVAGLPADFAAQWAANAARFPTGVDVILCAGAALAALPRTVRLAEGG